VLKTNGAILSSNNNDLSITGVWRLLPCESDSLKPFLIDCGVPRLAAPFLASAFNKDKIYIQRNVQSDTVSVKLKREGWSLPIKLQTDATYIRDQAVDLETPRGPQTCRKLESSERKLTIKKEGPSPNEQVDEHYILIDENMLMQTLRHRHGNTINTELRRFFSRD
jgi:hypothetical protein